MPVKFSSKPVQPIQRLAGHNRQRDKNFNNFFFYISSKYFHMRLVKAVILTVQTDSSMLFHCIGFLYFLFDKNSGDVQDNKLTLRNCNNIHEKS